MVYRFSNDNDVHYNVAWKMAKSWSFTPKMWFLSNFNIIWSIESNICAPVLLDLSNLLRKSDKMRGKPRILSLFLNSFDKFNKTWAFMLDPLCVSSWTKCTYHMRINCLSISMCNYPVRLLVLPYIPLLCRDLVETTWMSRLNQVFIGCVIEPCCVCCRC